MHDYPCKSSNLKVRMLTLSFCTFQSIFVLWLPILLWQNHFRDSYTYAIPDVVLELLCLSLISLNVAVDSTCGTMVKVTALTGWDYLSVQQFDHQTNVFLGHFHLAVTSWSRCKSHKTAAVWEWRETRKGLSGSGQFSLGAGRILGRSQRAAGWCCAQGAEGINRRITCVPGQGTTACQILEDSEGETQSQKCAFELYWM